MIWRNCHLFFSKTYWWNGICKAEYDTLRFPHKIFLLNMGRLSDDYVPFKLFFRPLVLTQSEHWKIYFYYISFFNNRHQFLSQQTLKYERLSPHCPSKLKIENPLISSNKTGCFCLYHRKTVQVNTFSRNQNCLITVVTEDDQNQIGQERQHLVFANVTHLMELLAPSTWN